MAQPSRDAEIHSQRDTLPDAARDAAAMICLDEFMSALQRSENPDRASILADFPELAGTLDCIAALDRLAAQVPIEEAQSQSPQLAVTVPHEPAAGRITPENWSVPTRVGDYEIEQELGRGGMGVVYKARQEALRRTVALKMILASPLASADQIRRFAREAQAAAMSQHPNVVRVLDAGQWHGQPFFVMEYVAGPSLAARIRDSALSPEEAVRLFTAICKGVAHLHSRRIIHRDLKPSNILIDEDDRPLVGDFGLARLLQPDIAATRTAELVGTLPYMAPELLSTRSESSTASDVYGLGCILYEMLTGRPPFVAESQVDLLLGILEREPVGPRRIDKRIPRALELICLKCLEKLPEKRYPTVDALLTDVLRFTASEPLEAEVGSRGRFLIRWLRREPALASRLCAYTLFMAIDLGVYAATGADKIFHGRMLAVYLLGVASAIAFQRLSKTERWSGIAPFVWGPVDVAALTAVLDLGNGPASAMTVGYPGLIVLSGLWFRVRLVTFVTSLAIVSYLAIVADYVIRRSDLRQEFPFPTSNFVFFVFGLFVVGAAVAYQVYRLRSLTRFFTLTSK